MESFAEVFTLVKEYCKKEVSPVPYDLWIAPIRRWASRTAKPGSR